MCDNLHETDVQTFQFYSICHTGKKRIVDLDDFSTPFTLPHRLQVVLEIQTLFPVFSLYFHPYLVVIATIPVVEFIFCLMEI